MRYWFNLIAGASLCAVLAPADAQETKKRENPRETKVRQDRKEIEAEGYWIYNDLSKAIAKAKETNKPIVVVLRCIPCEACAQLDAEVAERHPTIRKLLDEFVCLRLVHTNGMDLSLFQFDYDQSFAVFFLNADKTIYGRFGTRTHRTESEQDMSMEGLAKALEGALALHREYPGNRSALAGKHGPPAEVKVPENFPNLRGKYGPTLNYDGNVVASCIHCHQVGESLRLWHRAKGEPIPDKVLYPYPMPDLIGLTMDPKEKATVAQVAGGSVAEKAGFRAKDSIAALNGQPLLSIADMQWVFHNAKGGETISAVVERDGKDQKLSLTLPAAWRRAGDISWRATSWDLRRMAAGGLLLEEVPAELRHELKLGDDSLALRVKHVGEYGDHAVAKKAGFKKGDILIAFDGQTKPMRESDLFEQGLKHKPGDKVPVSVLRDGSTVELSLPIQ